MPTENFALDSLDRVYKRQRCSAIIIPKLRKKNFSRKNFSVAEFFFLGSELLAESFWQPAGNFAL